MFKTGVIFGKYLPLHRGHLMSIINAATQCKKLYVVISDNENETKNKCEENNIPLMNIKTRIKWLSQELQGFSHIEILALDETKIPVYPNGWNDWYSRLCQIVPSHIDVIFHGEIEYKKWFDEHEINNIMFDNNRLIIPISATDIRKNIYKNWEYLVGSTREFFSKKVLIAGTESCGKTTITKYLAKIFYTSWSEEVGRYYANKYLGDNEQVYTLEDFERIVIQQFEQDKKAIKAANKICFFDTDALITQYYSKLYIEKESSLIKKFINPNKYDLVLFFKPDVQWIDDGQRYNGEQEKRNELHSLLYDMYIQHGFKDKIIEISGNYNERLNKAIKLSEDLLS